MQMQSSKAPKYCIRSKLGKKYKTVLSKENIAIGLLRKLQKLMPTAALITIY